MQKKIFPSIIMITLLLAACSAEPSPTATSMPSATATQTKIPTATLTPLPTETPTEVPSPTATITQTPTPFPEPIIELDDLGVPIVLIPEGEFIMGVDPGPADASAHPVWLDAYYIDQYEVTNDLYAAFLNEMGNQTEEGSKWYRDDLDVTNIQEVDGVWTVDEGYEQIPVTRVSWYGSQAFCEWRGGKLPTEAQWEKAAKGVTDFVYPWGNEMSCEKTNYSSCGIGHSVDVGSYPLGASPYGVEDMAGNVAEYTADWYLKTYYDTSPYENPAGPYKTGTIQTLVSRGGSWYSTSTYLQVFYRNNEFVRHSSYRNVGFRCVINP